MADDFISGMLAGQQFQLNKFLLQEAPVKLEQQKLALKITEQTYDKQQQMAKLLAQNSSKIPEGQNPMTNASNALLQMGSAYVETGQPEQAIDAFAKASAISSAQETAAYHHSEEVIKKAQYIDSILAQATPNNWEELIKFTEMDLGQKSALRDKDGKITPFSPELIDVLRKRNEARRTDAQEALTKAQIERTKVETQLAQERMPLVAAQTEAAKTRAVLDKKVGGGLVANPKTIAAVADYLVKEYGDANLTATDARVKAREIGLHVDNLMRKQGMTQPAAVARAVQQARDHGDLAGITPAKLRPGQSADRPLPLPDKPEQLQDQMIYGTKDGPRWFSAKDQKFYKLSQGPDDGPPDDDDEEDDHE
jgi:tetratricopeptide (TPR) repeat protein